MLPRKDGEFQVLARINNNTYKLDLLYEYNMSATFNVYDLPLLGAGHELMMNPFKERRNDATQTTTNDLLTLPIRAITRAQAKRVKEALDELSKDFEKITRTTTSSNEHLKKIPNSSM